MTMYALLRTITFAAVSLAITPVFASKFEKNFIGIEVSKIDEDGPRTPVKKGVAVTHVAVGSPAEKAGMKAGFFIYRVNKKVVGSPMQFNDAIKESKQGEEIIFNLYGRYNGKPKQAVIKVKCISYGEYIESVADVHPNAFEPNTDVYSPFGSPVSHDELRPRIAIALRHDGQKLGYVTHFVHTGREYLGTILIRAGTSVIEVNRDRISSRDFVGGSTEISKIELTDAEVDTIADSDSIFIRYKKDSLSEDYPLSYQVVADVRFIRDLREYVETH